MRESVNAKKNRKFFLLQIIQNGPIRENKWLELKFETSDLRRVTRGPRLSHLLMIFEDVHYHYVAMSIYLTAKDDSANKLIMY